MSNSNLLIEAKNRIAAAKGTPLTIEQRKESAIELASLLLTEAKRIETHAEKRMQAQLTRMMNDARGKAFTTSMTDQCFRSQDPRRVADQLLYLLRQYGIPRFLNSAKRAQLKVFEFLGKSLANVTIPLTRAMLRKETRPLILPGEPDQLSKHIKQRRQEGVRVNLNHLGEAILGEMEAEQRLSTYLADLANPNIEYISIKISTLYSQINLLGWKDTLEALSQRLKKLYRAAKQNHYTLPDGRKTPKFINLDMEEYRDLLLTVELFRKVLDEAEFFELPAGIALQSYLPDSFLIQQELTLWAMQRVARGGAFIKIRIVKGANLAMEAVDASLHNWPQAPYLSKAQVDANFKRMVTYGCQAEHAKAVHLGIASHNLFDIAYAMLLRAETNTEAYVEFEMLEGMADHLRRVVQAAASNILLYCPAATEEEFQNAVAYLVRRLDENTAPENFLRHAFNMQPGTKEWQEQAALFSKACDDAASVSSAPQRQQNRLHPPVAPDYLSAFSNEPDTDWSLPQNRKWGEFLLQEMRNKYFETIPLVIGDQDIFGEVEYAAGHDPSVPHKELYRYALANESHLDLALDTAVAGFKEWSALPLQERLSLLHEAAHLLRSCRGQLIGAMVADTGKTVYEADVEVSEAIDFAQYYPRNVEEVYTLQDIHFHAKGPILIAPPWNFPSSIPVGGIIASLAAGNSVIFKPAPEAVLVGWYLVNVLWKAGISRKALQFFNCPDDPIGSKLVQDQRLAAVILTGSTETAKHLLTLRPSLDLMAETGGKNSIIITAMADRDLAIRDLVHSAFGHAGQKCSACSLAILEAEVYDDPLFKLKLRDAAASLKVGSAWELSTRINPLIHAPNDSLIRGLTTLDESEEWLLTPKQDPINPNLWSPGIKLGVRPSSFMHQTELFGPVLGLMRADNLQHAIQLANDTPYGLTSGIHTLDEREKHEWLAHIEAGNCYINRTITGAIVQRQPFGGIKESSFGRGVKAGGPNYTIALMRAEQTSLPQHKENPNLAVQALSDSFYRHSWTEEETKRWDASIGSYAFFWKHYFSKSHDPAKALGQDNFLRYLPRPCVLRVDPQDSFLDILCILAAALSCGSPLQISLPAPFAALEELCKEPCQVNVTIDSQDAFIDRIKTKNIKYLRLLSPPDATLQKVLADTACRATIAPVFANGRIELLHFLREMTISSDYHRYGNLGMREGEKRCSPSENSCCDPKKGCCCC